MIRMKRDGWIRDIKGLWILRFRYEWESLDQNRRFGLIREDFSLLVYHF